MTGLEPCTSAVGSGGYTTALFWAYCLFNLSFKVALFDPHNHLLNSQIPFCHLLAFEPGVAPMIMSFFGRFQNLPSHLSFLQCYWSSIRTHHFAQKWLPLCHTIGTYLGRFTWHNLTVAQSGLIPSTNDFGIPFRQFWTNWSKCNFSGKFLRHKSLEAFLCVEEVEGVSKSYSKPFQDSIFPSLLFSLSLCLSLSMFLYHKPVHLCYRSEALANR